MRCVWSILLLLFCLPVAATKQPKTIEWIMVDFAPYYIMNDKYEGTGRDESVIKLLEKALPEVSFKRTLLPASRAVHELSNPHNNTVCCRCIKTNTVSSIFSLRNTHQQWVYHPPLPYVKS
ncbi:hypothetical protein [Pseudoalteromonas sp. T1lg21]|uniref:hypothetical protein n=1 Tax=Pseudoalteromonas sp. T1lg21 TaxID=2077095 RepID=UPI002D777B6A|nr:hypothetical protein [Pseudoalteromonas sp. T1lg21]